MSDTITYNQLERILTRTLNQLAERDQQTREEKQKARLRECNKYYLPEHRYKWRTINGVRYIIDHEGNHYTDIETTLREIERAIGLR